VIRINVESDHFPEQKNGALPGNCILEISGHSGIDVKGKDILCAAVSVLGQTFVVSVSALEGIEQSVAQHDGFLKSTVVSDKASGESRVALRNYLDFLIRGIIELEKQYPEEIAFVVNLPGTAE